LRLGNTKSAYGWAKKPGLSGAAFFDLYTDPREESGKMLPTFPANVQCQDGSLTLYAGAKSPGVRRPAQHVNDECASGAIASRDGLAHAFGW
jgi:hypothetical protein